MLVWPELHHTPFPVAHRRARLLALINHSTTLDPADASLPANEPYRWPGPPYAHRAVIRVAIYRTVNESPVCGAVVRATTVMVAISALVWAQSLIVVAWPRKAAVVVSFLNNKILPLN